jgi:uncharacterized membrane protein
MFSKFTKTYYTIGLIFWAVALAVYFIGEEVKQSTGNGHDGLVLILMIVTLLIGALFFLFGRLKKEAARARLTN